MKVFLLFYKTYKCGYNIRIYGFNTNIPRDTGNVVMATLLVNSFRSNSINTFIPPFSQSYC